MSDGKAILIRPAHLPRPVALRCDQQHVLDRRGQIIGRRGTHTSRIRPMGLRKAQARPVPFRPATTARFEKQAQRRKRSPERPAGRIHSCRIFQRRFGTVHQLPKAEFSRRTVALPLVAWSASQREVAHLIRAAPGPRHKMLDLQRNVLLPAVGARPAPLLQDILSNFVARQFALLILDTTDLSVLHDLRIEPHQLHADGRDRAETQ